MPELPQVRVLAQEMDEAPVAKVVADVGVPQPQCLNVPEADSGAPLPGFGDVGISPTGTHSRGWGSTRAPGIRDASPAN